MKSTFYDILNVSHDAPPEIIAAAYKALAKRYQPAKGVQPGVDSAHIMKAIDAAYEVLSDPVKRKNYDASLAQPEQQHDPGEEIWPVLWTQPRAPEMSRLETEVWEPWYKRAVVAVGRGIAGVFGFWVSAIGFSIKALFMTMLILGGAYIMFRFVVAETCHFYIYEKSRRKGISLCQFSEGSADIIYYVLGGLIFVVLMAYHNMNSRK